MFVAMSAPLGDNSIEFAELIGNAPPRLSYVRDGVALYSWDDTMPDLEAVTAAIELFRASTAGSNPG
jgi:hypothetical protein